MAELLIKVGTNGLDPAWQDGDVLHAWNNRHIEYAYLSNELCHPWNATPNGDGLIDTGTIYEDLKRHTYRWKFEQLAEKTFRETNLVTLATRDITDDPEATNIKKWLNRQLRKTNAVNGGTYFPLFGITGAVVWYKREGNTSQPQLNLVWVDVEAKTPERQVDHQNSNLGQGDLKRILAVNTTNFNQATKEIYETQIVDDTDPENTFLVKRRTHLVPYWDIGGLKNHLTDIRDPNIVVDLRPTVLKAHANIVEVKP